MIVVRTYPDPAKRGLELSCTAAITDKGDGSDCFRCRTGASTRNRSFQNQWIEVGVTRATDPRPESHRISQETIKIKSEVLSTANAWQARKDVILPLKAESMCALRRIRDERGSPTLGIFKPATINRLIIKPTVPNWTQEETEIMRQGDLFEAEPAELLEKIPFDFSYEFRCADSSCKGHTMKCTDWEMGQTGRKWRIDYGDDWQSTFRQKFETEMRERFDTHFYVGTLNQYPDTWIVVGLFYPPKVVEPSSEAPRLF